MRIKCFVYKMCSKLRQSTVKYDCSICEVIGMKTQICQEFHTLVQQHQIFKSHDRQKNQEELYKKSTLDIPIRIIKGQ